jgi:L-ascorbate metabolism protein UlaG (beta-lactamase superfamily)
VSFGTFFLKEKRMHMSEIEIQYYGHSCFQVSYEGHSAVFDPYEDDSVPGLKLPAGIRSDAVYCSHEHTDHNAAHLIQTSGRDPFPLFRASVPHDDVQGAKRGFTDMTFLKVGCDTIVHLGDIGRMPTEEEYEALQKAAVLMIPVGGYYTIDASQAAEIIAKVQAPLNIVMHYRRGNQGYDVLADLDQIKKDIPSLKILSETKLIFDENSVPQEIAALEPLQ